MHNIILEITSDNSRLFKESVILREALAGNTEFFKGCKLCYDPTITFGVKKVPMHRGTNGPGLSWSAFEQLTSSLSNRKLTGHAARDAIEVAMLESTKSQWDTWYRPILIKDMRAGFSETTVNKMLSQAGRTGYKIPIFEAMLAHDGANHEKKVSGVKLLEIKGDGVRSLIVINVHNKTVIQYSRNGKVLENFSHITDSILKHIHLFDQDYVLDGEMMSASFQALMKQVNRKSNVQSGDARLLAFDMLPLAEFLAGKGTISQRDRSAELRAMKPVFDTIGSIDVIEQVEVDLDSLVGKMEFEQYNLDAIANKFEGIMIKDPEAVYECKRTVSWLKQKPVMTIDLTIVAVEEGTGKNVGRLGALVCEGEHDGQFIQVNVGSGFTDDQRDEIWKTKDTVHRHIIEVNADAITQSQVSDTVYSLRFPRFVRFRGFKAKEKL